MLFRSTGYAIGVLALSDYDVTLEVTGDVNAYGVATSIGVVAYGGDSSSVDIGGDVNVYSYFQDGYGILATGFNYATVNVGGDVEVYGYTYAGGIYAGSFGEATIDVDGNINVYAQNDDAYGAIAYSFADDASVTVGDGVDVYAEDDALGVAASSLGGNAIIDVTGDSTIDGNTEIGRAHV